MLGSYTSPHRIQKPFKQPITAQKQERPYKSLQLVLLFHRWRQEGSEREVRLRSCVEMGLGREAKVSHANIYSFSKHLLQVRALSYPGE